MLICDKRRPARARGYQYQAPPRGPNKDSPPASGPRLGRSLAGGLHPQTPRAAPPGAPSRTGPLLPRSSSRRGSGHGCDGGGGGQPLAVVHARRLAPGGFRASGKFQKVGRRKALRGVRGACPPCQWSGGQPVNGRWAVRVQPPGCARRPRAIGLSTAERVQGTAVEAVWPAAGAPTPASKN